MQKRKKFPKGKRHPSAEREPGERRGPPAPPADRRDSPSPLPRQGQNRRRRKTARPDLRKAAGGDLWLYGLHAVGAALANPARQIRRLLVAGGVVPRPIQEAIETATRRTSAPLPIEAVERPDLDALFPLDTVHQGVALLARPLDTPAIEDVLETLQSVRHALVVILDQVDDPRNVGAVLRSAAALGASALILPERHAPAETGALAKAASGALELLPLVRVTNIARTLDALKSAGFWCVGLAPDGDRELRPPDPPSRIALVLGAEGRGLRRLTLERCDEAARIPLAGPVASLNLSAAAAIALYAFRGCAQRPPASLPGA